MSGTVDGTAVDGTEDGTEKVRLASFGLGWWGEMLARSVAAAGNGEIVTCFARSEGSRDAFAAAVGCDTATSVDEVLADERVEGVLIATPHSTHLDLIERAAAAGKHVFVEKPLTLTYADGAAAIAATEAAGVLLQVGHNRRRAPAMRRLRALIDEGAIGRLGMLESNLSVPMGLETKSGWRSDPDECPLGGMTALGVHMVDNLIYLAGPAVAVSAMSRRTLGRNPTDDVTMLSLEFEGGALGYVGTSVVTPKLCITSVHGELGSAYSEEEGQRLFVQRTGELQRTEVEGVEGPDSIVDQMAAFCRAVRGGPGPEVDGWQGLEVVAVLEAAVRSASERRVVDVAEIRN
jgi:predicted dehydrogenase